VEEGTTQKIEKDIIKLGEEDSKENIEKLKKMAHRELAFLSDSNEKE